MGNLFADLLRVQYDADIGLSEGGVLRANKVYPKGPFTLRFVSDVLAWEDEIVVKRIPGHVLIKILENGISKYPMYDGRWPVFSGLKFSFDPEKPP